MGVEDDEVGAAFLKKYDREVLEYCHDVDNSDFNLAGGDRNRGDAPIEVGYSVDNKEIMEYCFDVDGNGGVFGGPDELNDDPANAVFMNRYNQELLEYDLDAVNGANRSRSQMDQN